MGWVEEVLETFIIFLWKRVQLIFLPLTTTMTSSLYMPMTGNGNCWSEMTRLTSAYTWKRLSRPSHQWHPEGTLLQLKELKSRCFRVSWRPAPADLPVPRRASQPVPMVTLDFFPRCISFRVPTTISNDNVGLLVNCLPLYKKGKSKMKGILFVFITGMPSIPSTVPSV